MYVFNVHINMQLHFPYFAFQVINLNYIITEVKSASFRGRPLQGKQLNIPSQYEGEDFLNFFQIYWVEIL